MPTCACVIITAGEIRAIVAICVISGSYGIWVLETCPISDSLSHAGQLGEGGLVKQLAGGLQQPGGGRFVVAALSQCPIHDLPVHGIK